MKEVHWEAFVTAQMRSDQWIDGGHFAGEWFIQHCFPIRESWAFLGRGNKKVDKMGFYVSIEGKRGGEVDWDTVIDVMFHFVDALGEGE